MPRWLIKKEGSVALSTNTFEHWTHVLTWTFYRHHLFGKAMCSYEIGHSNNSAIKQSAYKLYQPKIYSAQISSPPQQSKALLQRDDAKPFLLVLLDSPKWLSQVCLPPRNIATWHSLGIKQKWEWEGHGEGAILYFSLGHNPSVHQLGSKSLNPFSFV